MPKVVRRVINHKYFSVKPEIIIEGTVIPFDCFIKRFEDFVIIIEAGTLIVKDLFEKLHQHQKIYILKMDSEKLYEYSAEHAKENKVVLLSLSKREAIEAALKLKERLASVVLFEEQLEVIYTTVAALMEVIFESKNEELPIIAIQTCVSELVECCSNFGVNAMPSILKVMHKEYATHYHSTNVAMLTAVLSKVQQCSKVDMTDFVFAALLHDIGKLRIDESILIKPGPLEQNEYAIVIQHSDYGHAILEANGITSQKILNGVRYHHEKLDGSGYPKQLRGKMIPKSARIIGMCDVFDALTTKRTFRASYTTYEALLLMKQDMSNQFDESFIDSFIRQLQ